jgi:8-oxo-dGTP diphosphatase
LLARRACEPLKGYWNLPGWFLEKNEEPRAGMLRELKEETGVDIEPQGLAGIYIGDYNDPQQGYYYTFNVVYAAKLNAAEMQAADDTSELKFFPFDKLPEMAFPHETQALADFKKGIRRNC